MSICCVQHIDKLPGRKFTKLSQTCYSLSIDFWGKIWYNIYVPKGGARKEEKKMKIIDKRNNQHPFYDIAIGLCFIDDDGKVSMKITDINTNETFAVELCSGELWNPHYNDKYQIVDAILEIE